MLAQAVADSAGMPSRVAQFLTSVAVPIDPGRGCSRSGNLSDAFGASGPGCEHRIPGPAEKMHVHGSGGVPASFVWFDGSPPMVTSSWTTIGPGIDCPPLFVTVIANSQGAVSSQLAETAVL